MWIADKEKSDVRINEHYLSIVKIRPEKNSGLAVRDFNLCALRYRCSALPTELTS